MEWQTLADGSSHSLVIILSFVSVSASLVMPHKPPKRKVHSKAYDPVTWPRHAYVAYTCYTCSRTANKGHTLGTPPHPFYMPLNRSRFAWQQCHETIADPIFDSWRVLATCYVFFPKASPMLGFSFSLLCRRGSDTEGTTGWTVRKPWEIAWGEVCWGELRWEGARRKRGHRGWTGNRGKAPLGGSETEARKPWTDGLGRALLGGSETEAWTPWTDGKPWEIAWGEFRWEGAKRKRGHRWTDRKPWEIGESSVGRERDGSVDVVDGWETVGNMGNSLGRAPVGGSETEAWTPWTDRKPWEMGRAPLGGSKAQALTSRKDGKPWEIAWGELR